MAVSRLKRTRRNSSGTTMVSYMVVDLCLLTERLQCQKVGRFRMAVVGSLHSTGLKNLIMLHSLVGIFNGGDGIPSSGAMILSAAGRIFPRFSNGERAWRIKIRLRSPSSFFLYTKPAIIVRCNPRTSSSSYKCAFLGRLRRGQNCPDLHNQSGSLFAALLCCHIPRFREIMH